MLKKNRRGYQPAAAGPCGLGLGQDRSAVSVSRRTVWASGRCPDNGASVDLTTCQFSAGSGATELKTRWRDSEYTADQSAFYYVRVLMNPTCRWSTYDAIRLGRTPDPRVPATIRERAWSSPIWVTGKT